MADSNPDAVSFPVDACWQGRRVEATVVARHNNIEIYPTPDFCLELSPQAFEELAPQVIVAVHTRRQPAS